MMDPILNDYEHSVTNRIAKFGDLPDFPKMEDFGITRAELDDYLFDCLAKKPAAGIVVEAFGCGNVPLKVMDGIKECREHGIPVVLTSRTYGGKVVPIYGYKGSARTLLPYGVILADELTGQKARIKLMVALAVTNDNDELKKIFHSV